MYSTRLKRKLAGYSSGLAPNGEQNSSWMNPPVPLTLNGKKIMGTQTEGARAKVVLTSAVGTMRKPCAACSLKSPMNHAMMSTGRKSMEFMRSTQTNTVSASGATNLCGSPWNMPFTWSLMKSKQSSTNACRFVGTPELAPLATHQKKPTPMNPTITPTMIESRLSVMNPPSPTGLEKKVRW